jgi:hypothetical protein
MAASLALGATTEVPPSGGAARLSIVVSEARAFVGQLVEVRGAAGHDALVIDTDVGPADVVARYEDNVGFLLFGRYRP